MLDSSFPLFTCLHKNNDLVALLLIKVISYYYFLIKMH